jgi:hypothetical protein
MSDSQLTTDELRRWLDEEDPPRVNRRRLERGLRPLCLQEMAERWETPHIYVEKMKDLEGRL